tara:strand:+ start:111 stop:644 length:534 start_codon:yes stop_codon:yes gene_type:complete
MLDFAELRNRILMGEDEVPEEVKESPLTQEFLRPATGFPILFGGLSVAFVIADKLKLEILAQDGEYNYRPLILSIFGLFPLGFGLGELARGLQAQKQFERYERLVVAAESEVERLTEDDEEQAEQDNTNEGNTYEAESFFNLDPIAGVEGVFSGPLIGQTQPTVGPRPSYEAQTFGW